MTSLLCLRYSGELQTDRMIPAGNGEDLSTTEKTGAHGWTPVSIEAVLSESPTRPVRYRPRAGSFRPSGSLCQRRDQRLPAASNAIPFGKSNPSTHSLECAVGQNSNDRTRIRGLLQEVGRKLDRVQVSVRPKRNVGNHRQTKRVIRDCSIGGNLDDLGATWGERTTTDRLT